MQAIKLSDSKKVNSKDSSLPTVCYYIFEKKTSKSSFCSFNGFVMCSQRFYSLKITLMYKPVMWQTIQLHLKGDLPAPDNLDLLIITVANSTIKHLLWTAYSTQHLYKNCWLPPPVSSHVRLASLLSWYPHTSKQRGHCQPLFCF